MCIMYLSRCTRLVVSAALRVKTRYPSTGYPADVQWITSFPTCSTCFGRQNVSHSLQWRDEPDLDACSTSPSITKGRYAQYKPVSITLHILKYQRKYPTMPRLN